MATIKIKCDELDLEFEVTPKQDILNCIVKALIASMPVFLESFFKCIAGDGDSAGEYKPGDRTRCE